MTVTELIARLNSMPPEARVVVNGYEDGFDDLSEAQVSSVHIAITGEERPWWVGRHMAATDAVDENPHIEEAVALWRASGPNSRSPSPG